MTQARTEWVETCHCNIVLLRLLCCGPVSSFADVAISEQASGDKSRYRIQHKPYFTQELKITGGAKCEVMPRIQRQTLPNLE